MPANADLTLFLSAGRPTADGVTSGGARDSAWRPLDDQLTVADTMSVVSDDAADTRTVTVTGRLTTGQIDTEDIVLTGTTPANGATTFERILALTLSASHATRTVTVTDQTSPEFSSVLGPDIVGRQINFYAAASQVGAVDREEKIFAHNAAADDLTDATVELTADPGGKLMFAVETTKDSAASIADRLANTFSLSFADENTGAVSVPESGNFLGADEAIGIILEQALDAGNNPLKSSYQITIAGTSIT